VLGKVFAGLILILVLTICFYLNFYSMKIFDQKQFLALSQKRGEPFISIYIPVSRISSDGYHADKTHLKNQLSKAEKNLREEYDMQDRDIDKLLSPAKSLLDDLDFWKYNSDMLACFLHDGEMETFQLPIHIDESMCFISYKPFMLPLIPELNDNGHYYLLLLNLERIRLYGVTRNVIQEIELDSEAVARSFTEEEEQDENQQSLQGQGNVGSGQAMYHGHGAGSDEEKKVTIQNYFHRMTNMLEPILYQNPLPLYIAGVEYLGPLFRKANKYNHLMDGQVIGAFSENDMKELHQKSWDIAEPVLLQERIKRNENFSNMEAQNLAIGNDRKKLLKAALTGGVETLMVNNKHEHIWGKYDANTHEIHFSDKKEKDNHCLVDEAAVKVKADGGKVYLVESPYMPGTDEVIVGTLRYELPD
jgi:hypothetical protein